MIDITKFLTQNSPNKIAYNSFFFEHICDFYNNDVPQKYIDQHNDCSINGYEYLDENLQTHDYKKLQEKLYKEYEKEIYGFANLDYKDTGKDKKSFWIELNDIKDKSFKLGLNSILNKEPELFFKILEFFNYRYSKYDIIEGRLCYLIEPILSEKMNNEFKDKYHGQAYHFTLKSNIQSILKNGLKIRCGDKNKGKYREFPKRIYLYMGYERINQLNQKELYHFIKDIFPNNNFNEIGIIKVDLYGVSFPIYKDSAMKYERAAFIYNNIPADYLKEIKVEL